MTMSEEESEEFRILRDAIDVRRDDMERNEYLNEFRRGLARILKPAALAASVTPYDAALGDVAYGIGELIDPEGDPELAALAASTGLLTGGAGSGAMTARMAGRSAKSKKATGLLDSHPTVRDRIKNLDPMKRPEPQYPMKRPEPQYPMKRPDAPYPMKRPDAPYPMKRPDAPYPMKRTEPYPPESQLRPPTPIEREASLAGARSYQHAAGDPDMRKAYIDQLKRDLSIDESNDGYITDEMIIDYMLSNNIRL